MKKIQWLRYLSLFIFLALLTWIGYKHQVLGGGPSGAPSVDALCPFGGVENIYSLSTEGTWLRRTAPSSMILFIGAFVVTLFFGRVFCGWICPLGAITEFTRKIAGKLGLKRHTLPRTLDTILRLGKYIVLVLALYFTAHLGTLAIRDYDPWVGYMHLSAGFSELSIGFFILIFFLVLELFIERAWCKYACPLGAVFAITNIFSPLKVRRNASTCISCGKCDKICPTGIPIATSLKANNECLSCMQCVGVCPTKKNTLTYSLKSGKQFNPLLIALLGLALFLGVFAVSQVTGHWATQPPLADMKAENPTDKIFGWMSFDEMSAILNISPEKMKEIGKLPLDLPNNVSIKKLPEVNDEILKEQLAEYIKKQTSPKIALPNEIKGSQTLQEIADIYALNPTDILNEASMPLDFPLDVPMNVKAKELGLEVQSIRDAVKKLIENTF